MIYTTYNRFSLYNSQLTAHSSRLTARSLCSLSEACCQIPKVPMSKGPLEEDVD